jgi:hypothetical protein
MKDKIMLPKLFDIKDYLGNSGARIPELVNYLGDKYNYNPGSFTNNISSTLVVIRVKRR